MSAPPVTVNLPEPLYNKLKERADQSRRTVEAELLDVVASAAPLTEALPLALAESADIA